MNQLKFFYLSLRQKAEERYLKTTKLSPSDPIPFFALGKIFAIPVLKTEMKNGSEKVLKRVCI